jgi:acylphosphatase
MPCLRLLISGRVQGVWFRESMRQEALKLGATGWVRNLPDGEVEAVICGDPAILDALLVWSKRGPPLAKVAHVETTETQEDTFLAFENRG